MDVGKEREKGLGSSGARTRSPKAQEESLDFMEEAMGREGRSFSRRQTWEQRYFKRMNLTGIRWMAHRTVRDKEEFIVCYSACVYAVCREGCHLLHFLFFCQGAHVLLYQAAMALESANTWPAVFQGHDGLDLPPRSLPGLQFGHPLKRCICQSG